ncbi:MAG: 3-oxoacyl-ACP synthase [Bacteroidetes bacterium]|nr:3-oxoacyl-ACP synthase [Bacteroidota bacterium]
MAKKKSNPKEALYQACLAYAEKRIQTATEAYKSAQDSANEETKNTASEDDNSKAMLQIEAEQQAKHMVEARKLKEEMLRIDPSLETNQVMAGSLVITSLGNYYISISAGKIDLDKKSYFAISLSAPVAQALKGKKTGEKVKFNDKMIEILDVI